MASDLETDFYSILNIKPNATKHEIKEAYRRLALQRHPDKNPGDVGACAAFQKLAEAYYNLYDENRRILYDAKEAQRGTLRRDTQEKEWTEKERVAAEKIMRLETEIEKIAATIKNYDRLERERLEKEKQSSGWWSFLSSLGESAETAKKRASSARSEAHDRAMQPVMLKLAQDRLMSSKRDMAEIQRKRAEQEQENRERGARAREAKEAFAHQQEELKRNEAAKRAAQEKERQAQEARRKEAEAGQRATREKEIRERDLRERLRRKMDEQASTTSAAQQKATREMEIRERDLRERLRRKMGAQASPTTAKVDVVKEKAQEETTKTKAEAAQPSSQFPNPGLRHHPLDGSDPPSTSHLTPQPFPKPETNATLQPAHARQRGPPKPKASTSCSHKSFWPKVQGRHKCSVCSRILPMYIFQCDGCGVRACNDCRKMLKK
ncbi:hypothetical protein MMC07_006219 [Pseudocyphellaria aurata]|nr:hypothetical protein [Pseudocyphellaria aurata]